MRRSQFFAAIMLTLCLSVIGTAGSDTAKKIIGLWEITKGDAPPGATIEFTKDGKLSLRAKVNNMDLKVDGTYEVKDESIVSKLTFNGQTKSETHKITKLTDKQLIVQDEQGKSEEYKRVK